MGFREEDRIIAVTAAAAASRVNRFKKILNLL